MKLEEEFDVSPLMSKQVQYTYLRLLEYQQMSFVYYTIFQRVISIELILHLTRYRYNFNVNYL